MLHINSHKLMESSQGASLVVKELRWSTELNNMKASILKAVSSSYCKSYGAIPNQVGVLNNEASTYLHTSEASTYLHTSEASTYLHTSEASTYLHTKVTYICDCCRIKQVVILCFPNSS